MAFTRDDISTVQTFTRDGATTSIAPPSFNVFNTTQGPTTFSLGPDWSIRSVSKGCQGNETATLEFKIRGTSKLTITDTGIEQFTMDKLSLGPRASEPATNVGYTQGDLIKVNGVLFVLSGGGDES